jgi:chorismate mutase
VTDPVIAEIREGITAADEQILAAINRRIELVARLKRHKESQGLEFVDPKQEEAVLRDLSRANRGPLSPDGLQSLYREIIELTKREVSE